MYICFVFVPYVLMLPVSGLSFKSIKMCSVLFKNISQSFFFRSSGPIYVMKASVISVKLNF